MGRSPEINRRMRKERRDKILSAALRLFASQGLAATTLGHIAERAHMSQGLAYHYFPSKEAIYLELLAGAFRRMNQAARALETLPIPAREKISRAIAELVAGLARNEDTARYHLLIAQASASDATPRSAQALIRRQRKVPYAVMARVLRAGQRDGSVRKGDPAELSLVFWALVRGLAIHRAAWGKGCRLPRPAALASIFLTGE